MHFCFIILYMLLIIDICMMTRYFQSLFKLLIFRGYAIPTAHVKTCPKKDGHVKLPKPNGSKGHIYNSL